jgi:hypothetical protein
MRKKKMRERIAKELRTLKNVYVYKVILKSSVLGEDRLSGLEFLATDPEVPGSTPGATRFSDK